MLQDSVYFAYFPPYQYTKHQELVARTQCKDSVCLHVLGKSIEGRDLDLLQIGTPLLHRCGDKIWVLIWVVSVRMSLGLVVLTLSSQHKEG